MIRRRTAPYAGRERRMKVVSTTASNVAGLRLRADAIAFYLISSSGDGTGAFVRATEGALVLDFSKSAGVVVALRDAGFTFDALSASSLDALALASRGAA